jgi:probable phosphoglycerate mutase
MTTIYVIRHAEAEGNLYRIAQGQYDSALTDRGWRQVRALEERFRDVPVDAVYSSDLFRARATALAVAGPRRLPVLLRPGLREINVGPWEQQTWGDILRRDPVEMDNFLNHLERWHLSGAETPEQVRNRVVRTVRQIASENPDRTVAVVSHGCAIRILLAAVQGYSLTQLSATPLGDNTAVSLLTAEGEELRVLWRDDNRHLQPLAAQEPPRKRFNALEPGLRFTPLRLPEEAEFLSACAGAAWRDGGETRPWCRETLLREAAERPTLVAWLGDRPVGLLQLHPDKDDAWGWISQYCMVPEARRGGWGIQMLGQAVKYYRPLGRAALRLSLPESNDAARRFFVRCGFCSAARADGRVELTKNIALRLPQSQEAAG